jgi:DNA-binding PadR family transcriptional regulator
MIRLHILCHASKGPIFGLWIIEELGRHGYKLSPGTLYPILHALERKGYLRNHAAREDTIIFPAWKQTMTGNQLDEMNDKFEDIEHEQFGADGFKDAVKQISAIENSLGLVDISQFTAPPPPKG